MSQYDIKNHANGLKNHKENKEVLDLYALLEEGENAVSQGDKKPLKEVISKLKKTYQKNSQ